MNVSKTCPFTGENRFLVNALHNARKYAWVSEKTSCGRRVVLNVDDAIRVAKLNEFVGVVLFADRIHFVESISGHYVNKPVIRLDNIDVIDKINKAIAARQFLSDNGDAHHVFPSKVESVPA
jgi:hypothetical protein